jgi:hypothetical protein
MGADPGLLKTMETLGLTDDFTQDRIFNDFDDVIEAYRRQDVK